MKTVCDEYNFLGNQDFVPLVAAIAEIIDNMQVLAAPREEPSLASNRGQRPAIALFQAPDSATGSLSRGAGARSPSPAGILKRPCANPTCSKVSRPDTGYCGRVCAMAHDAPCKNAPKGCRVSAANCLSGGLCGPNCLFEQQQQDTKQGGKVLPPCSNS